MQNSFVPRIARSAAALRMARKTKATAAILTNPRTKTRFFTASAPSPPLPPSSASSEANSLFLPLVDSAQSDINQAELLFQSVWKGLLTKYGEEKLSFPGEIIWLAGAPGSGKGHMTGRIMESRGITSKPIEIGALLISPECQAIKARGLLVDDRTVLELLLETLIRPDYSSGVIVDGFVRSKVQAECTKLLYNQIQLLREKYAHTPLYQRFRRPIFHIIVLYIDKEESVRRQLMRGQQAKAHNEIVQTTGIGRLQIVRETDINGELAAERYKQFKNQVYESLKSVKDKFHFHFIQADGAPRQVEEYILNELKYQSAMELGDETFERLRKIPLASEIILHARLELVRRLDDYQLRQASLFHQIIELIQQDFIHILKRQALSGRAIIRSNHSILRESGAIDMALDILSERGYTVVLDIQKIQIPYKFHMATGFMELQENRVYEFQIEFPRPNIRRGQ